MILSRALLLLTSLAVVLAQQGSDSFTGHAQQLAEAKTLLREASSLIPEVEKFEQPALAANIAGQMTRAGDLPDALATLARLPDERDRTLGQSSIAYTLAAGGDLSKALEILSAAGNGTDAANGYLQIAQHLTEKRRFGDALNVVHQMPANGPPAVLVDALLRISVQQSKAGESAAAANTIDEALSIIERERERGKLSPFEIAAMYREAARRLAAAGQQTRAEGIIWQIRDLFAAAADPESAQVSASCVSTAQAAIGDVDAALTTVETMAPRENRATSFFEIALAAAEHGDLYQARDVAARISDQNLRYGALLDIAVATVRSGDASEALLVIDDIQDDENRARAFAQLALDEAVDDDPAAAQSLELARNAAARGGPKAENFVFELIAVTSGVLGDLQGALDVTNELGSDSRSWPLWNLTAMLVRAGRTQEAIALAHAQTDPKAKAYALLGIAGGLIDP